MKNALVGVLLLQCIQHQRVHYSYDHMLVVLYVMINSFSVELRRNFTVRNMKEIPVFVQSSELSIRT